MKHISKYVPVAESLEKESESGVGTASITPDSQSNANERWKSFRSGAYEVSSFGRVRRMLPAINARVGEIKKCGKHPNGYTHFTAYENGTRKFHYVHRAVAEVFIGKIPQNHEINHKNGVKSDNRICNLEIVTRSQNSLHAIASGLAIPFKNRKIHKGRDHWTQKSPHLVKTKGNLNGARIHPEKILRGQDCPSSKLTEASVLKIRQLALSGMHPREIAALFYVTRENVNCIVKRKTWRHL